MSVGAYASGSDGAISEVVYQNGSPAGVKVHALGSASSLARSGIEPGDVVTRVDGRLATTSDVMDLSGVPLADGSAATVEVIRGDQTRVYQVSRAKAAQRTPAGAVRMVPVFTEGKCLGMKVFGVSNDSVLSKRGVKNGDTVVRVAGFGLDSPENALKAYSAAKKDVESTVAVLRDGKQLELRMNAALFFEGLTY